MGISLAASHMPSSFLLGRDFTGSGRLFWQHLPGKLDESRYLRLEPIDDHLRIWHQPSVGRDAEPEVTNVAEDTDANSEVTRARYPEVHLP